MQQPDTSSEAVWSATQEYFKAKNSLEIPQEVSASFGFRFGMALAMRHPEYAQAFVRLLNNQLTASVEGTLADEFIEAVPLEGEFDAALN